MSIKPMMSAKNVLITGATSGIGLALFNQYSGRGDNVIACGRDESKLAVIAEKAHQTCLFDLNNPKAMEQALQKIENLDLVILNAGDCQ